MEKEIPLTEKKLRSFVLWYLQGSLHPLFKIFEFRGTLPEAGIRAKKHCTIMEYKFIRVRPHIVDLDQQEGLKLQNSSWSEDQEVFDAVAENNRKAEITRTQQMVTK